MVKNGDFCPVRGNQDGTKHSQGEFSTLLPASQSDMKVLEKRKKFSRALAERNIVEFPELRFSRAKANSKGQRERPERVVPSVAVGSVETGRCSQSRG